MEIFSNILQLDCIYQFDGDVKQNYSWCGVVLANFNNYLSNQKDSTIFDLEGLAVDISDTQKSIKIHKRYLLGNGGINQTDKKVSFSVFAGNIAPLDYIVQYDEDDCCFYGAWYFVNNYDFTTSLGGYAKLLVSPVYERCKRDIEVEINGWCMSKYYMQYLKPISYLIEEQKSNIADHGDLNELVFNEAKEYFKKIDREKVLILEK